MRISQNAARKKPKDRPQSADFLRAFLDASVSGCVAFDQAGDFIHSNPAGCEILGVTANAVLTLEDFCPADRTGKAYVQFERFRAGKLAHLQERCQLKRKGGAVFWADLSLTRMQTDAQSPCLIASVVDIDLQKTADAELVRNDARWETALEAAGQGVWEFDRQTDKLTLTQGWKRMRGIPIDEEVSMEREAWLSRVHPDDHARISKTSDDQGKGEDGFDTLEYRERHRDGHYIWIYSRGRPYEFDAEGNPLRVIGTDANITKLKTVEAELAAEKELLRVTLQSIGDGVISADVDGRVTFLNPAAEQMTGWAKAEALGRPVKSIFNTVLDGAKSRRSHTVANCIKSGTVQKLVGFSKLVSRNGEERYLREVATPVTEEDGKVVGAVVVFQDASQRRHLQIQLEFAASHDRLTGLPNRAAFEVRLATAINSAIPGGIRHSLCLIDLDHFKAVNDGAGHAAGDALLVEVAQRLLDCCRSSDCVARIGGDEFAVVLDGANTRSARAIAEKMVQSVSNLHFAWEEQTFRIGASIGIAPIDGKSGDPIEIYKTADEACYIAKRNGRNCVVVGG